eukprot:s1202_g9.t1
MQDVLDEAGFVMDETLEQMTVKVAIRKIPSTQSHVLGAFEAGDELTLFDADVTGAWRKLHYKLKGGYGSLVEAWVMLRHHEFGALVQRADGKSDRVEAKEPVPTEAPVLAPAVDTSVEEEVDKTARAAALAAEFGERLMLMSAQDVRRFMPTGNRRTFEVAWKPTVAVRTMPHRDALIVTTAEHGLEIDTFGTDETGEWRKVYCSCTSSGREDAPLPETPLAAWMLEKHETLGVLLRSVEDAMRPTAKSLDLLVGNYCAQKVSRFSWAVAKLACADAAVTDHLAEEQAACVGEFHAVNLANILWANAKLLNKSEKLVDSLCGASMRRVEEFNAQNLANAVWAIATLSYTLTEKMGAFIEQSILKIHEFGPQGLANTQNLRSRSAMVFFEGALLNHTAFSGGRFRASRRLVAREPILALPERTCWTPSAARKCQVLQRLLDQDVSDSIWMAFHILLAHDGRLGEPYTSQMALLREAAEGLLLWDDEDLLHLQGSRWLDIAKQGREEILEEFAALHDFLGEEGAAELGASPERYLWAQAILLQYLLRFVRSDGTAVEIFMPELAVLEAESLGAATLEAPGLARLESAGQESMLVFYAPRILEEGELVQLCHGGLACCAGRALFERGRFAPRSPASHFEFALTVPVPPKMSDKVSKKVAELAPDGLQPGQFLPAEAVEEWQPAVLVEGSLQLNVRISEQDPLPAAAVMELLKLALDKESEEIAEQTAMNVLSHALLSINKEYLAAATRPKVPEASTVVSRQRRQRARALIEEEKWLLGLGQSALEAPSSLKPPPHAAMAMPVWHRMEGCAESLQRLCVSFAWLSPGQGEEARALLSELRALRACLAGFPDGNPETVALVQVPASSNQALRSHSKVSLAALRARLAACTWEISSLRALCEDAEDRRHEALLAGVLGEAAALHIRLLQFREAHAKLAECLQLSPDSHTAKSLARDCAMALGSRAEDVLGMGPRISWKEVTSVSAELKETLQGAGYTQENLPKAAGLPSMLHFVSNRGESLANALQARVRIGDVSQDLADLVRLFLLRRLLPLQRVVALLGEEITSAFLRLQAFCLIVGPNSRVCSASEAAEILSTASHNADLELFSAIAIWPLEEDLLIATDYGDTQHSAHFEPVMYLSLDSYALVSAAPREPVQRVLDVCCGSGVQGIVALRTYAEQATFVDINPRCLAFTRFNAALNGFYERASFIQGSVDTLTDLGLFQAILANPPFVPNPENTAAAAAPLYSGAGCDGEAVHRAIFAKALHLLGSGGYLSTVAEVPNPESLATRVKNWIEDGQAEDAVRPNMTVKLFTGKRVPAEEYWRSATQERSELERRSYAEGLRAVGVHCMAEALVLARHDGRSELSHDAGTVVIADNVQRDQLWVDDESWAFAKMEQKFDELMAAVAQEVEAGPLSSLPVLTAKLLVEVLVDSSDATTFQTNIDARSSEKTCPPCKDIDQILRVISEEQAQLLQLAEEQHASFSMSVQLAFARMERSDLLSRGGFGRRGRGLCAASPCDLCTAEGNEDDTQEVFQDVPDQTDMLSSDGFDAHQHSSSLRQIDSTFSVPTSPSRAKSKKSANSKPTAEDLLGLDHFIDRSKAWTDLLAGMLVLINSFVMLVELEVEGRAVGALIGMGEGPILDDVSPLFRTLDAIFVFVFLAELLLRIFMEKLQFVRDVANWFDTLLVIAGLVDMFVILPMSDGAEGQNIVMLRMVRVLKCVRAIRLVRTFRFFRGLRLLVKACYCFLPSLGWSMVLLLVFMWMGTLVLGNLLQDFITDPLNNFEDRVWIWNRYGTAYRAMYTLYEILDIVIGNSAFE